MHTGFMNRKSVEAVYLQSSNISIKSTTIIPPISLSLNSLAICNQEIARTVIFFYKNHANDYSNGLLIRNILSRKLEGL